MKSQRPKVGVGVIVRDSGKVLLGKRKNAHGEGDWSFPGGHLEYGEDVFACAKREVKEETGIDIKDLTKGPYTNDFFEKEEKHYITIYVVADLASGSPQVMEPEKCERWEWFDWDELPEPLFIPVQNLKKQEYTPF